MGWRDLQELPESEDEMIKPCEKSKDGRHEWISFPDVRPYCCHCQKYLLDYEICDLLNKLESHRLSEEEKEALKIGRDILASQAEKALSMYIAIRCRKAVSVIKRILEQ